MAPNSKPVLSRNKIKEITVKSVNKPSKEKARQKTKELSEFLSKTWHMPINSE